MKPKQQTTLPRRIVLVFTECDRLNADDFCKGGSCLAATSAKRRGFTEVSEGVDEILLNGVKYTHKWFGGKAAHFIHDAACRPFYGPEVVGKRLVLTREA